jgi:hypothetical protein
MNLFQRQGMTSVTAVIEELQGRLALIPTAGRGTMPNVQGRSVRKAHAILAPHIPYNDAVYADDVQGVRAFGSEDATESVTQIVNDKLTNMRQSHEVTLEYHRIGAIQGVVLDADGITQLYDFFDIFGLTETEVDFDLALDDMKTKSLEVIRLIGRALGATPYQKIHAMCGDNFFDKFVANDTVKSAYEIYRQNGSFGLEQQNGEGGFEFGGITWENYTGYVGNRNFIPTDTARFFPVGVPDLFLTRDAPANFVEAVNTIGKPVYAKQKPMDWDVGIELHTQSNPLNMCTRPAVLIKGNDTASSTS